MGGCKGLELTLTNASGGTLFGANELFDERLKWFGTVRGRLGYLPFDNLLTFITGGFAYGRVERTVTMISAGPNGFGEDTTGGPGFNCLIVGAPCFAGTSSNTNTGWTIGGGLEYALWGNLTIKAEYLYVSLAGQSVTTAATGFSFL